MINTAQTLLLLMLTFVTMSCANHERQATASSNEAAMANAFKPYFDIGVAMNRKQATGLDVPGADIIKHHFSSLTPENDMKWESVQAIEGQFTFVNADALVAFAKKHQKNIVGHALVWHEQTPDWVFQDQQGKPASRELLLARMKAHIFALAGRYKDDIKAWDVVNEALNEDGTLRASKWLSIIGPDFIEKAFEFAALAAPKAELYYNDYNLFKAPKLDAALAIAKRLQDKGIRIDGIGEQAHYGAFNGASAPISALEISIKKVAASGLKMMITELDVSVLKFPDSANMGADISLNFALQDAYNPFPNAISSEANKHLANTYLDLFSLFIRYHQYIDRVTLWGVSDEGSWRNNWPMKGRTDYPLLFDRKHQAKPFVSDLITMAEQSR